MATENNVQMNEKRRITFTLTLPVKQRRAICDKFALKFRTLKEGLRNKPYRRRAGAPDGRR